MKKYLFIFLIIIIFIVSLKIPNILEANYPLAKEDRTEAFYNAKYLLQGLFSLVAVIFINTALLLCVFKKPK